MKQTTIGDESVTQLLICTAIHAFLLLWKFTIAPRCFSEQDFVMYFLLMVLALDVLYKTVLETVS